MLPFLPAAGLPLANVTKWTVEKTQNCTFAEYACSKRTGDGVWKRARRREGRGRLGGRTEIILRAET